MFELLTPKHEPKNWELLSGLVAVYFKFLLPSAYRKIIFGIILLKILKEHLSYIKNEDGNRGIIAGKNWDYYETNNFNATTRCSL